MAFADLPIGWTCRGWRLDYVHVDGQSRSTRWEFVTDGSEQIVVSLRDEQVPRYEVRAGGGHPLLAMMEIQAALAGDGTALLSRLAAKARATAELERMIRLRLPDLTAHRLGPLTRYAGHLSGLPEIVNEAWRAQPWHDRTSPVHP